MSRCLKQIIWIQLNRVKNTNWPEANQLAIYKRGRGFELETQLAAKAGLELGASELQVQGSNHSATLPPPVLRSLEILYKPSGNKMVFLWRRQEYLREMTRHTRTIPTAMPNEIDTA